MKKLIGIALLAISSVGFAQEQEGKAVREKLETTTPEQRTEKHLKKLTTDLQLDAKQQDQIKQVLAEQGQKRAEMKKMRDDRKASGQKPTKEERDAFKKEMMSSKESMEEKMKTILTPEQYEKWAENKEKKREMRKEKMQEKQQEKK